MGYLSTRGAERYRGVCCETLVAVFVGNGWAVGVVIQFPLLAAF